MARGDGTGPGGLIGGHRRPWSGGLPSLADARARTVVFFATYLYQGLVAGFSLTALANHLAGRGVPAGEVGLHFAVAGLPWTVQPILWGPLVDRASGSRMGRRRAWGVLAVLGGHAALALLLLVPGPEALLPLALVFLAHSLCASLLDTVCDRLILDHVPSDQLGRTSAATRAGFVTGTSLAAALFAWMLTAHGLGTSAACLLGLGGLATLPMLLVREAPGDALLSLRAGPAPPRPALPFRRFLRRLGIGLRRPRALRLLALCVSLDGAVALFEVPFTVDLVQGQGWAAGDLSRLQAGLGLATGTLGALAIGLWSDRAGPLAPLRALLGASALAFTGAGALVAAGWTAAAGPAVLALTNVLPGLLVVALVPALMRASRGRAGAATQFEVFMAAMNFGSVAGAALAGPLAARLPLAGLAGLAALVFLAGAGLAARPALILARTEAPPDPGPARREGAGATEA